MITINSDVTVTDLLSEGDIQKLEKDFNGPVNHNKIAHTPRSIRRFDEEKKKRMGFESK